MLSICFYLSHVKFSMCSSFSKDVEDWFGYVKWEDFSDISFNIKQ